MNKRIRFLIYGMVFLFGLGTGLVWEARNAYTIVFTYSGQPYSCDLDTASITHQWSSPLCSDLTKACIVTAWDVSR